MPEGDTLRRTADGLRPFIVGRRVVAASARQPGPRAELLVGTTVEAVEAVGKNLIIRFGSGLELRTHLGMHGSWHRYRPGERWRRPASRARLVIEVPGALAVCFDAPTVELLDVRAQAFHPPLARLGPDLLDAAFDGAAAVARLRAEERSGMPIAEALLDQRALAGIGNVYKSETLFVEAVHPFAPVGSLDDEALARLVATARRLLMANADRTRGADRRTTDVAGALPVRGGPGDGVRGGASAAVRVEASAGVRGDAPGADRGVPPGGSSDEPRDVVAFTTAAAPALSARTGALWVYGRAGRPCRICGARVVSRRHGELPRVTYWCPRCQPEVVR